MSLTHFSFASPSWLWALLLLPLVFGYALVLRQRRSRFSVDYTNLGVLRAVARTRRPHWWWRLPLLLIALALIMAAAALAQPRLQLTTADRTATVVLLVDVSESMEAFDIPPSRLAAAVTAMNEFVAELPASDKVGLVTFSDKVEVLNTPTTDHTAIDSSLATLSPQGGTALGEGITEAVKLVVSSLAAAGVRHTPGTYLPAAIVLESDGAQNRGTISPFQAAELAKQAGVRVFGVALGKPSAEITVGSGFSAYHIPVPPDPATVALLARDTNGASFTATDTSRLFDIYHQLGLSVGRNPQLSDVSSWFDAAAAALLVTGFAAARVRGAALP